MVGGRPQLALCLGPGVASPGQRGCVQSELPGSTWPGGLGREGVLAGEQPWAEPRASVGPVPPALGNPSLTDGGPSPRFSFPAWVPHHCKEHGLLEGHQVDCFWGQP